MPSAGGVRATDSGRASASPSPEPDEDGDAEGDDDDEEILGQQSSKKTKASKKKKGGLSTGLAGLDVAGKQDHKYTNEISQMVRIGAPEDKAMLT